MRLDLGVGRRHSEREFSEKSGVAFRPLSADFSEESDVGF